MDVLSGPQFPSSFRHIRGRNGTTCPKLYQTNPLFAVIRTKHRHLPTPERNPSRPRFTPPARIGIRFTMDRPSTANPATAREIIVEIVRNMREGLEPLHYTTLPPAIFHVYLPPDDMERLRGISSRIVDEARRALDAEIDNLNRAGIAERLK